jgi:hypothetical protein
MICRECKKEYTNSDADYFSEWYCSKLCKNKGVKRDTDSAMDEIEKRRYGQLGCQGVKTCDWGKYY